MYSLSRWGGEEGGRWIVWYEFRVTIENLIDKHDIKPVGGNFLPQMGMPVTASPPGPWPCGGIKTPHFHYGGEVFPVSREQWNEFASNVIDVCAKRLEVAKTVSLPVSSVATIGEAAASLGILASEDRKLK